MAGAGGGGGAGLAKSNFGKVAHSFFFLHQVLGERRAVPETTKSRSHMTTLFSRSGGLLWIGSQKDNVTFFVSFEKKRNDSHLIRRGEKGKAEKKRIHKQRGDKTRQPRNSGIWKSANTDKARQARNWAPHPIYSSVPSITGTLLWRELHITLCFITRASRNLISSGIWNLKS